MKNLNSKKIMAAKVLGVGKNKVWFDPSRLNEINEAITKQDIADLIKNKAIKRKPETGVKRRAGKRKLKRKGRKRKQGKIKMRIHKENYPKRIRRLRSFLRKLRNENKIQKKEYRRFYLLLKAGELKNKQHILEKVDAKNIKKKTKKKNK